MGAPELVQGHAIGRGYLGTVGLSLATFKRGTRLRLGFLWGARFCWQRQACILMSPIGKGASIVEILADRRRRVFTTFADCRKWR
jgi:hypothetical protein